MHNPSLKQKAALKSLSKAFRSVNYAIYVALRNDTDFNFKKEARGLKARAEYIMRNYGVSREDIIHVVMEYYAGLFNENYYDEALTYAELFKLDDTYSDSPRYGHMTDDDIQKEIDDLQEEFEKRRKKYSMSDE